MKTDEINAKVTQCFENIGILIENDDNFTLSEYIVDSLTYMTFLVELEQMFNVIIPDEFLCQEKLQSRQNVVNMIEILLKQSSSKEEL